jgi:4-diphosphocytidyl-2-C-methyl-D-erythritol kinase
LEQTDFSDASTAFYNSLEAPVFHKYPWLALLKEYLLEHGALAALLSGSGSTTFAITGSQEEAERLREGALRQFGEENWTSIVQLPSGA